MESCLDSGLQSTLSTVVWSATLEMVERADKRPTELHITNSLHGTSMLITRMKN